MFWLILVAVATLLAVLVLRREPKERTGPPDTTPSRTTEDGKTGYRPQDRSGAPRIKFSEPEKLGCPSRWGESLGGPELEGLHDAFTGVPLVISAGLQQCKNCKVYYHSSSIDVLRAENQSRCVSCGSRDFAAVGSVSGSGRDYTPAVINLENYRRYLDRVVTFEGVVQDVRVSRRGTDYAAMFEDKPWTKGLKLIFFKGDASIMGGTQYIVDLKRKRIRARGLLVDHPKYGPQIIVSQKSMIQQVWS